MVRATTDRRRRALPAAAISLTLAGSLGLTLTACGSSAPAPRPSTTSPTTAAIADARHFLGGYVDGDGRVVRRDQGGDTVSEGQAYALLLAVAANDRRRFESIWNWTREHLQQQSGLFAYRWTNGRADPTPAADADLQTAWALALGGEHFGEPQWTQASRQIATAVASTEIGYDDAGKPTLAAGPWAVQQGQPTVVEPGYWTPQAATALGKLTGDHRLQALPGADLHHLATLTDNGSRLPPDWAQVGGGADPRPIGARDGSAPVQAGPDGLRALVWTAADPAGRTLAGRWWPLIRTTAQDAPQVWTLDGHPQQSDQAPLSAVAAAAAAHAAGDDKQRDALLDRADDIAQNFPTYYGTAWAALGRALLTTDLLAGG